MAAAGEYRITVQGGLARRWWDCLGDLEVRVLEGEFNSTVTILHGHLADQAALCGVLKTLNELGLPLIAVARLGGESNRGSRVEEPRPERNQE